MDEQNNAGLRASSKRAVIVYSVALFVIVVFFIALSYFISARGEEQVEAISAEHTTALQRVDMLRSENERLTAELEEKTALAAELEEELRQVRLDWAEDTKRIEDKYKTDYNELLQELNNLLLQLEAGETDENDMESAE